MHWTGNACPSIGKSGVNVLFVCDYSAASGGVRVVDVVSNYHIKQEHPSKKICYPVLMGFSLKVT